MKDWSGIACLLAGVWELRGIRNKIDQGISSLCLDDKAVQYMFSRCSETIK
jgi:hypothetical protein